MFKIRIHVLSAVIFFAVFSFISFTEAYEAASECPDLHDQMYKGVRNSQVHGEVLKLQEFLSQFPDTYPEKIVSGYFGTATEHAVQKWQSDHGIVSSGSVWTTGYGLVGAQTRASIKNACNGAGGSLRAPLTISKEKADAYKITAHFAVADSQCVSYVVDWGDKSDVTTYSKNTPNCKSDTMNINTTHRYSEPGNYILTIRAGKDAISRIPIVAQKTISITSGGTKNKASTKQSHMTVSPSKGKLPFKTNITITAGSALLCTAYSIDWGDDSTPLVFDPKDYESTCYGNTFSRTFSHTYEKEGTYTLIAKAGPDRIENLKSMTLNIDVYDKNWTPDTTKKKTQKRCFVYPNIGYTPMKTAAYVPLGGESCDDTYEYYVVWGDGTKTDKRSCKNKAEHYDLFFHKYTIAGDYKAELIQTRDGVSLPKKTCDVEITNEPTLDIVRPKGGDRVVIGKPFGLSWKTESVPVANEEGIDPTIRLTFITQDKKVGFIADVPASTESYTWTPIDHDCGKDICPTPLIEGKYYIQATMIYDACDGDPYCDTESEVLAVGRSHEPVSIFKRGSPSYGKSWMLDVNDRLFAYPASGNIPLIAHFNTVLNSTASCAGGVYTLDFGDGTSAAHSYPQGGCKAFAAAFSHTYLQPGVYTVSLIKNGIKETQVTIQAQPRYTLHVKNIASVWTAFKQLLLNTFLDK